MSTLHARKESEDFKQIVPAAYAAIMALGKAIEESGLDKKLLELLKIRASQINGCAFCAQLHLNVARKHDVPQEKLDLVAVWRDAGIFSDRERAAFAWTEILTDVGRQGVSDAAYAAIREQFSETELAYLTAAVGHINLWNRIAVAFRFSPPIPQRAAAGGCRMSETSTGHGADPTAVLPSLDMRFADDEDNVAACYPLMRQLRPHLTSAAEFIERWRRQTSAGYRLLAIWRGEEPIVLAGFRVQDNLVHGFHLYVDDLVTLETARSSGYGQQMIARLAAEGRKLGCSKLVLDTPLTNVLGHRFYYRNGLLATALRFTMPLN